MKDYINNSNYLITKDGIVYSKSYRGTNKQGILSPIKHSLGYLRVNIAGRMIGIHRLVAETYIDNPASLPEVDHIDGDKANNRLDNLRWVSHQDNIKYGMKRLGNWLKEAPRRRVPVIAFSKSGTFRFESMRHAAEYLGKDVADVRTRICRAIRTKGKTYGYTWARL